MAWQIAYDDSALRDTKGITSSVLTRIRDTMLKKLCAHPIRHSKPLSGSLREYRVFRVGDYRILFSLRVDDEIIVVHKIAHRREVYER